MALLNLQNVSFGFGSIPLLDCVDLQIHQGEKICLLGRNGAGKSTMMNLINGGIEPDSGSMFREKGLKTALLSQEVPRDLSGTVYAVIAGGAGVHDSLLNHLDNAEEQKIHIQIEKTISLLKLDPELLFENLSAGMKRRVLLGRALVNEPDILLLDEPTNHLDIESIKWLEDFLSRYNKTIFFVTHDRAFLQKIANRIVELDRGKLFDWKCDYRTFLQRKDAWLESEETRNALFDKKLAQEEAWIRQGIKARRTRNEGRVRALLKLRGERAARRERAGNVRMEMQRAGNSGKMIIEATDISFGYTDEKLFSGFSTRIMRGDRIGIIGPNGCGKSTLIKTLLGELETQSGDVRIGAGIQKAYFDQLRNQLDDNLTIKQNVSGSGEIIDFNGRKRHVIGYLEDFLFSPDRADEPVKVLSGGEKNRLLLAKLFTKAFNFLIMDEPTNDLDIETIELLEGLLLDYEGTLLLVSHDRSFLNNVVTGIFAFEGNSEVREYAGGYDDWLAQKPDKTVKEEKQKKNDRVKKTPEKTKLSFKEKKEYESIHLVIEEKEKRKHEIYALMADPSFYKQSGPKVTEIKAELEQLEKELDLLFIRWEELEAIGGGIN
ncbi:MAG: ATP-binding cassette domain-containing protein [Spirochaetota bacterium]